MLAEFCPQSDLSFAEISQPKRFLCSNIQLSHGQTQNLIPALHISLTNKKRFIFAKKFVKFLITFFLKIGLVQVFGNQFGDWFQILESVAGVKFFDFGPKFGGGGLGYQARGGGTR